MGKAFPKASSQRVEHARRCRAAVCKLQASYYPNPETWLFRLILERAIVDLTLDLRHGEGSHNYWAVQTAKNYLNGDMPEAVTCGLEPEYVRRVLDTLECDYHLNHEVQT